MILHIAPDNKFIPFLQSVFEEALPANNIWRVVTDKVNPIFVAPSSDLQLVDNNYFDSKKFINDLERVDCLVFHSLFFSNKSKLSILKNMPRHIPVVWRGWGYDYYRYLQSKGLRLFLHETDALTKRLSVSRLFRIRNLPSKIVNKLHNTIVGKFVDKKFIARIDYFSCCVPDDFKSLKQVLPDWQAKFLPLNYYSHEDVFLHGINQEDLSGEDILLGNSSTPANNHIEALQILSKLNMQGRRVIVPLSYGNMNYRDKIIQQGKMLLGDSFMPVSDYMPLEEYNTLISSCSNIVMNHIRQQAMGNISAALLRGGKVFLRKENPIYKYYSRMGVKLYKFDEAMKNEDLNDPLTADDKLKNKEILSALWARNHALEQVKLIDRLKRTEL